MVRYLFSVLYVMIAVKTMGFEALGREAVAQNEFQKSIRCGAGSDVGLRQKGLQGYRIFDGQRVACGNNS